jgi:hypothetical protein
VENKKLYEMDLKTDFICAFAEELEFGEGRFINVETYEGMERVWYDPCGYHQKLIEEFNNYKFQIVDILAKGVKPKDLAYLLKLDIKLFNIYYEYVFEILDYSCMDLTKYDDIDSMKSDEYNFYFDDDEYKNLRLF